MKVLIHIHMAQYQKPFHNIAGSVELYTGDRLNSSKSCKITLFNACYTTLGWDSACNRAKHAALYTHYVPNICAFPSSLSSLSCHRSHSW